MHTPTASARTLQIALATAGASLPDACARAGVDPSLLDDPAERVPHEVVARTWEALAAGDEAFGLRAARRVEAMGRSLFEYAILNAADVRGLLENFVRLQRIMHDASAHSLDERAATAVLRLDLAPPLRLPPLIGEFIAASFVLRLRLFLRDLTEPCEVRLPRPRPADPSLVDEVFRAPVTYGSPHAEVHWPRRVLDQPLVAADPALHAVLVREIERALGLPAPPRAPAHRGAGDDTIVRLKRALRVALGRGDSSLGKVARMMAMSGRSLERRLSERGMSFQGVRDEVRHVIAEDLLVSRGASVTEAAFATGFSEVAAFTRAFRRWNGVPPSEFLRAKAASRQGVAR